MILTGRRIFLDGRFVPGRLTFDTLFRAVERLDRPWDGGGTGGGTHCGRGAAEAGGAQEVFDAGEDYVIPGLIDLHTHAAVGADASDGSAGGLERMSRYYAADGVTAWCPTTMTLLEPQLTAALAAVRDFRRPRDGARSAGVNLEGPFLSREKCGAQNPANLHAPDAALFHRLNEAAGGLVRLVTVAPELPGAEAFIRETSRACTVALGHTAADYDTALRAFAAGARHATHLFNAMPPLGHRAPGVVGAAFDAGATVELIPDGLHLAPTVLRMGFRLFGERTVLISDSLRCAGMPDGQYELGGQSVTLRGGRATLSGTDTLAGSSIHLMEGLRRAVSFGVPLAEAVAAATGAPAKVLGLEGRLGALVPGGYADFVVLDASLAVRAVFLDGTRIR